MSKSLIEKLLGSGKQTTACLDAADCGYEGNVCDGDCDSSGHGEGRALGIGYYYAIWLGRRL